MRAVVFLGPTLAVAEAERLLDAEYRPPVQRGDVLAALAYHPAAIGIVDGYFGTVPSVWHKEILAAMAAGVHVFGAASMGALRAAELEPFGMVGVGQVFGWYRSGAIEADDEVAVAHGPVEDGFVRLSDSMVDIRDACLAAEAAGVIPAPLSTALSAIAQGLYYTDRSFRLVLELAGRRGEDPAALDGMARFVAGYGPGAKERDARALLEHMAGFLDGVTAPLDVGYRVERTVFLERLEQEVAQRLAAHADELPADDDAVLRTGESLAVLRKKVLLRVLARREAERIGLRVDEREMQDAVDAFRRTFDLLTVADTQEWAAAEGMTNDIFLDVIRDGVLIDKLERFYGHRLGAKLAGQIRMASAQRWRGRQRDRAPQ